MMDRVTRVMVEIIVPVSWQQWYSPPSITTGGQVVVKHGWQKFYRTLIIYSRVKSVLSGHSKRTPKIGFQYQLSLNAGQKYCRMLQGEHSAILPTFIKLPFVIKIFVLSIFEWPLKTGLIVPFTLLFTPLLTRSQVHVNEVLTTSQLPR